MLKLTKNSSPFYNRSYFLLRRVKLGFPFLENKPMTILQIMKLLHHSQGYSQYTFIQKYRISHISHSGLNRHWSIMWAFKGPGLGGDTCEDPPSVTTNSQSGGGRGREGGREGGGRKEATEGNTGAVRRRLPLSSSQRSSIGSLLKRPAATFTDYLHLKNSNELHVEHGGSRGRSGASCCIRPNRSHFLRQTSRSDHAVAGRRSNAAQRVQPGTARVYAHYHVTVTLRL